MRSRALCSFQIAEYEIAQTNEVSAMTEIGNLRSAIHRFAGIRFCEDKRVGLRKGRDNVGAAETVNQFALGGAADRVFSSRAENGRSTIANAQGWRNRVAFGANNVETRLQPMALSSAVLLKISADVALATLVPII